MRILNEKRCKYIQLLTLAHAAVEREKKFEYV